MAGLDDYLIGKVLDHVFAATSYTAPTTLYLALYTGDPLAAGAEVNTTTEDTAYARQTITFGAEGATENNKVHTDASATFAAVVYGTNGTPYTVTHACVMDAATSGNRLVVGALPSSIQRNVGETVTFDTGKIFVELART